MSASLKSQGDKADRFRVSADARSDRLQTNRRWDQIKLAQIAAPFEDCKNHGPRANRHPRVRSEVGDQMREHADGYGFERVVFPLKSQLAENKRRILELRGQLYGSQIDRGRLYGAQIDPYLLHAFVLALIALVVQLWAGGDDGSCYGGKVCDNSATHYLISMKTDAISLDIRAVNGRTANVEYISGLSKARIVRIVYSDGCEAAGIDVRG
jgi:hypothetical protein